MTEVPAIWVLLIFVSLSAKLGGKMASKAMAVGPHNTHLESLEVLLRKLCFKELISKVIWEESKKASKSHVCLVHFCCQAWVIVLVRSTV